MAHLILVLSAFAADSADSACPDGSESVQAVFEDGTCTNTELCSLLPGGLCPTWEQTLSQCVDGTHWVCMDCSSASDFAHVAIEMAPTYRAAYYYNSAGEQTGYHIVRYGGTPLCCGGQLSFTYLEGSGGECRYAEIVRGEAVDSGSKSEPSCGGCAGEEAVLWVGMLALLGGSLGRWKRLDR